MSDPPPTDEGIERAILALAGARGPEKSICPSEVARALAGEDGSWRVLMPAIRHVAFAMRDRGVIRVTQAGRDVPDDVPRGPIWLRGMAGPEE